MDPLSITAACVSLTASIAKTSITVSTFVRAVRSARSDLDAVSRELASLTTLLELIAEDAKDIDNFPETLRKHITGILANCQLVLVEVQRLVEKYDKPGVTRAAKWTITGSEDVAKLQLSLEAHKSALEIALEMVTLSIAKEIKTDTTQIRDDTEAIKQDTSEILQEIARLRAQLPNNQLTLLPSTQASDSTLARYLDDLTSYAETVCWSGEDSDTDVEADDASVKPKSMPRPGNPPQKSANSQKASPLPSVSEKPRRMLSPIDENTSNVPPNREIPSPSPDLQSLKISAIDESQGKVATSSPPAIRSPVLSVTLEDCLKELDHLNTQIQSLYGFLGSAEAPHPGSIRQALRIHREIRYCQSWLRGVSLPPGVKTQKDYTIQEKINICLPKINHWRADAKAIQLEPSDYLVDLFFYSEDEETSPWTSECTSKRQWNMETCNPVLFKVKANGQYSGFPWYLDLKYGEIINVVSAASPNLFLGYKEGGSEISALYFPKERVEKYEPRQPEQPQRSIRKTELKSELPDKPSTKSKISKSEKPSRNGVPPTLFQVKAKITLREMAPGYLIFNEGQIINVTEEHFPEWYTGFVDGDPSCLTGRLARADVDKVGLETSNRHPHQTRETPQQEPGSTIIEREQNKRSPILFQVIAIRPFNSYAVEDRLHFHKDQIINVTAEPSPKLYRGYVEGTSPEQEGNFTRISVNKIKPDRSPDRSLGRIRKPNPTVRLIRKAAHEPVRIEPANQQAKGLPPTLFQARGVRDREYPFFTDDLCFKKDQVINIIAEIDDDKYHGYVVDNGLEIFGNVTKNLIKKCEPDAPVLFQVEVIRDCQVGVTNEFKLEMVRNGEAPVSEDYRQFEGGQIMNVTAVNNHGWYCGHVFSEAESKLKCEIPKYLVKKCVTPPTLFKVEITYSHDLYLFEMHKQTIERGQIFNVTADHSAEMYRGYMESSETKEEFQFPRWKAKIYERKPAQSIPRDSCNSIATAPEDWAASRPLKTCPKESLSVQTNQITGEIAVVKSYSRSLQDDRSYEVKIKREAEILTLLKHRNIVQLHYFTSTSDSWLLYFEHAGDITLPDFIAQYGRLSDYAGAQEFAQQIGSALQYCHLHCIYHNNLRADKVIVASKSGVKITGFGSMTMMEVDSRYSFDTFSYGTVIYHMLHGEAPWHPDQNQERFSNKLDWTTIRLPKASNECRDVLSGLLGKDSFSIGDALAHPWLRHAIHHPYGAHIPPRKPLVGGLEEPIIRKLSPFHFGTSEHIMREMGAVLHSSEYSAATDQYNVASVARNHPQMSQLPFHRKIFREKIFAGFTDGRSKSKDKFLSDPALDFYERLDGSLRSLMIATYYLAKEKMEETRADAKKL